MDYALILVLLIAAASSLAIAALSMRVLWGLVRRGHNAAGEAFERGERLTRFIDPSKAMPARGPQDDRRLADGSRAHRRFGEIMREERASCRVYDR